MEFRTFRRQATVEEILGKESLRLLVPWSTVVRCMISEVALQCKTPPSLSQIESLNEPIAARHSQSVDFPFSNTPFTFQWDDPFGSLSGPPGAQRDLRLFLFDTSGNLITSTPATDIGGDPVVFVTFNAVTVGLGFGLCGGSNSPPLQMKYISFGPIEILDFATDSSTSFGHPNMPFTAGVGAALFVDTPEFGQSPPLLQTFSSAGGTQIFFEEDGTRKATPEVRQQPRFVGVDGTSNTVLGQLGTPLNFVGKSRCSC